MGVIYLLHFERSYHHARHYLGYTDDLEGGSRRTAPAAAVRWSPPRSATGSTSSSPQPGQAIATKSVAYTATATRRGGCVRSAAPTRHRS